ncbi:protein of unknown function [Taphrina deformans PYCC 5710]|uniref:Uncharacterized protein n=1 Tax=Taphrina deformans (strain PYCC 5710 / ATCC 11124 / CBS 356.35 / IMI 108563 / JCM 9778 / NBRC 8474) TaxID=1097556 RepID=R4XLX0_TAPDE|nr:protein of unknown function [Taphrina deformans PYCC 5710]|eukprot:CCG84290.1 protein of unknown function [Taphrina deformans PYCC 5710]
MNQSDNASVPPGHGDVDYAQYNGSHAQTYQYGGGHHASMVNEKTVRPSALKVFSSRFSTTSYMGARELSDQQRVKQEEHALQVSQMTWLDRKRQNKRFALYTFLGLNGIMLLIIVVTALVWVSLHLIKKHSTVGIPVNQNLQTVSN